jgi:hypothetical protein
MVDAELTTVFRGPSDRGLGKTRQARLCKIVTWQKGQMILNSK